ncbi:MAG: ATP synthase F1 subunit delta [Rickettsiaceae bacterium]
MLISQTRIVNNYTVALFNTIADLPSVVEVLEQLVELNDKLNRNKNVYDILICPVIEASLKLDIIKKIVESLNMSETVSKFALLLVESHRIDLLNEIINNLRILYNQASKVTNVRIIASKALDENSIDYIKSYLQNFIKNNVKITLTQDSDLIKGVMIYYNDYQVNCSVNGILDNISNLHKLALI